MRHIRIVLLALVVLVASGCSLTIKTPEPHILLVMADAKIPTHGTTPAHRKSILEATQRISPELRRAPTGISIYEDHDPHVYERTDDGSYTAAHCHPHGFICFRETRVSRRNIRHEFSHARNDVLTYTEHNEWTELMRERCGAHTQQPLGQVFPRNGVATRYGGLNDGENLAEWVTLILGIVEDHEAPPRVSDRIDPIYHQIFDYLHRTHFLTDRQYAAICKIL